MSEQVTFEEIVRAWILEYDDRLPNDKKDRIEAFIILLGNLNDHGYKKEDLTNNKKEKIVRSCVNPNHHKAKLKIWISMVVNALDAAILIYYGTVKIRKDIVTPEMASKIEAIGQKTEEARPLKNSEAEENAETNNPDQPLDLEPESIDINSEVKNAVKNVGQQEFQITNEILDAMSGPEIIWDEDFEKKLGIK